MFEKIFNLYMFKAGSAFVKLSLKNLYIISYCLLFFHDLYTRLCKYICKRKKSTY